MGLQKIEHLELCVEDVDAAVAFYTNVVGLVELARDGDVAYLGCGFDGNWDVAFREGATSVSHVAFRADDADEVAAAERALTEHGLATERRDGAEPNQEEAVRFELDSGLGVEYAVVSDKRYHLLAEPSHPSRRGFQPLDLDHIAVQTSDVKETASLFLDVLGWRETEHLELEPGSDTWHGAFIRKGSLHHDVTIALGNKRMHHWSLGVASIDHLKYAIDILAAAGTRLEMGVSRHRAGGNIFAYFLMPDGHRLELSCEMAVIDDDTPPRTWTDRSGFDAWGHAVPTPEFLVGT